MTADQVGGDPSNPASWNKYAYTDGDPINAYDPHGLYAECPGGTITDGSGFGCEPVDWPDGSVSEWCYNMYPLASTNLAGYEMYCGQQFFQGGGGGGGGAPLSGSTMFHLTLNSDCQKGLTSGMKGPDDDVNDQARLDALSRAAGSSNILSAAASAYGLDWRLLMGIGIEETGFRNLSGGGWFQFTDASGVSPDCAANLECAANAAAKILSGNLQLLSGFKVRGRSLTGDALTTALLDSWNAGVTGVERAFLRGRSADSASTNKHYGTTALEISKCYSQ